MKIKLIIILLLISNVVYSQIDPNQPEGTDFGYALTESATAGELLVYGDLCYFGADGKIWKTDADLDSMANRLLCIVREDTLFVGYQGKVLLNGKYVTSGLTPRTKYYVSNTPGVFTSIAPTYPAIRKFIGYSVDDKVLYFLPTFSEDDYVAFADTNSQVRIGSVQEIGGLKSFMTIPRIIETFTAGTELNAGDLCYFGPAGRMLQASASEDTTSNKLLAISLEPVGVGNPGTFLLFGIYDESDSLTTGGILYISETAGAIATEAPTMTGSIVRIIGYALSDRKVYFDPDKTYIEN